MLGAGALRPVAPSPAGGAARTGGAGGDGPKPLAAPRTAVGSEVTQTGSGTIGAALPEEPETPNWARYGILSVIFATLLGAGWRWWRSGRPGTAAGAGEDPLHERDRLRMEPTFAPPARQPPGRDFHARRL